jgi:dethiobiotin synthetase
VSSYFVTGTDTGVGKTLVSTSLLRKLAANGRRVIGMKPVASGCRSTDQGLRNEDAERLIAESTENTDYATINPYAFEPAIAPHLAAHDAGIRIELETIVDRYRALCRLADCVVVEGVGGWRVPLGQELTTEHMAKALNLPIILVVGMRLGCLNHALLTTEAIHAAGLQLTGWVANRLGADMERIDDNIHSLSSRLPAQLLGVIPPIPAEDPARVDRYLRLPG